jgi:hypothetical protein
VRLFAVRPPSGFDPATCENLAKGLQAMFESAQHRLGVEADSLPQAVERRDMTAAGHATAQNAWARRHAQLASFYAGDGRRFPRMKRHPDEPVEDMAPDEPVEDMAPIANALKARTSAEVRVLKAVDKWHTATTDASMSAAEAKLITAIKTWTDARRGVVEIREDWEDWEEFEEE